jgi:hypothetical protein
MSKNHTDECKDNRRRKVILSLLLPVLAVGALTGGGVYAAVRADSFNTTPQAVTSGSLKLTMDAASFNQSVTNMAIGDTRTQYVDLTNSGTLAGKGLTLSVADATASPLTTDVTRGLAVTVQNCASAWSSGTCASPVAMTTSTPIASMGTAVALSTSDNPVGQVWHLKVTLALPDSVEVVENGTLPVNSVQSRAASLTWRFSEAQRAAVAS